MTEAEDEPMSADDEMVYRLVDQIAKRFLEKLSVAMEEFSKDETKRLGNNIEARIYFVAIAEALGNFLAATMLLEDVNDPAWFGILIESAEEAGLDVLEYHARHGSNNGA